MPHHPHVKAKQQEPTVMQPIIYASAQLLKLRALCLKRVTMPMEFVSVTLVVHVPHFLRELIATWLTAYVNVPQPLTHVLCYPPVCTVM